MHSLRLVVVCMFVLAGCRPDPLIPPTGLSATARSSTGVRLAWTDVNAVETGFAIERASGSTFFEIATTERDVTEFDDATVTPGTSWRYRVRARRGTETSEASNIAMVTTPGGTSAPNAPGSFMGMAVSPSEVQLNWADLSVDETGFELQRAVASGAFATIAMVSRDTTSFRDTGLTPGETVRYRLASFNAAGTSSFAGPISVTLPSGAGGGGPSGGGAATGGGPTGGGVATGGGAATGGGPTGGGPSGGGGGSATGGGGAPMGGGVTGGGAAMGGGSPTGGGGATAFSITITKSGNGVGTVSATGINCGSDCTENFPAGTTLVLTATPASGSTFAGWVGCFSTMGNTCTVMVTFNMTVTATFTQPPTVTFAGGTLSALRAWSPSLVFNGLTLTGVLTLAPTDLPSVTITANTFTIANGGGVSFTQTACSYVAAPSLTINASTSINLNAGTVSLMGKSGTGTTTSSTCNECSGVRGGDVTLNAPTIALSGQGSINVEGGYGSYLDVGSGVRTGCAGGAGGTVTLNGSSAITVGANSKIEFNGGAAANGSGGGGNGTPGTNGRETFIGAIPVFQEYELSSGVENNGLAQNVDPRTYQRFDIQGAVNLADNRSSAGQNGSAVMTFSGGATDFCEDLYVLELKSAATIRLALSSSGVGDKDLHLFNRNLTTVLASSNGATSTENISYSAPIGTYVVCVSWADDNALSSSSEVPYTLAVGP